MALAFVPFMPDGGLREIYDRTLGYQASRPSPFWIWGQDDSLDWLRTAVKAVAGLLALAVAFVPRRRARAGRGARRGGDDRDGAGRRHWFYLYVVWFAPLALVALFAPSAIRATSRRRRPCSGRPEPAA